jgi:hypothetical protein
MLSEGSNERQQKFSAEGSKQASTVYIANRYGQV